MQDNHKPLPAHVAAIHQEHDQLMAQLEQLDAALEKLVCYSELFSDLATANHAAAESKWIAEWLPRHYQHEETTVLAQIAQVSPELAAFAREMKRQHKQLRLRLENLREMLNHLPSAPDLEGAVGAVKRAGSDFTRAMRLHIAAEEKKFSGLEN
jgi:hemerythrin-like domain-containing protein